MSINYKSYPIKIDGSSVIGDILSLPFGTSDDAMNYEAAVTAVLDTLASRAGGVAERVMAALPKDKTVVIVPFDGGGGTCNAWANDATIFEKGHARVSFSPATWKIGGMCKASDTAGVGNTSEEILLHEFLHAFRKVRGTYNRIAFSLPDKAYDDIEELFAILITNIYASERGKTKFRKDHAGFVELPAQWATSEGFMRDKDFFKWIEYFWLTEKSLTMNIAGSLANFNPIKAYKALIDAQEQAQAASW